MAKDPFYTQLKFDRDVRAGVVQCFAYILQVRAADQPDPVNKFFASVKLGENAFTYPGGPDPAHTCDVAFQFNLDIATVSEYYNKLIELVPKGGNAILRDLYDYFIENNLITPLEVDKIYDIIDSYLEFKSSVNDVSPETRAEVDRLAAMSPEEFEAEMAKEAEEDGGPDTEETEVSSDEPETQTESVGEEPITADEGEPNTTEE